MGEFSIKKIISEYKYKLDLPNTMNIHPLFHVSLIDLVVTDLILGQIEYFPSPVKVNDKKITLGCSHLRMHKEDKVSRNTT